MSKLERLFFNWFFKSKLTIYNNFNEYENRSVIERFSGKWWAEIVMKIVMMTIIILSSLLMFGCSPKVITEYKTVNVPVKCNVQIPKKPNSSGDILKDNTLILKYNEELLLLLKKCN